MEAENYLDKRILLYRGYFSPQLCETYFTRLRKEIKWLKRGYENDGNPVFLPRLTANYGEKSYDYSGLTFTPEPWTALLSELKDIAQTESGGDFNALICQLYRDGKDGVGWHSDDDGNVGINPLIVSMSFGETRAFWFRSKKGDLRLNLEMRDGDLLIMQGDLQHTYVHKVPKEPDKGERINLTFRNIFESEGAEFLGV